MIEYLVPVAVASSDTINMDVVLAMSALNTLRNVIAVDALDTLLRAYSSFIDRHNAISHCIRTSGICLFALNSAYRLLSVLI